MSPRHLSLAAALVAVTSTFAASASADAIGAGAPQQQGCFVSPVRGQYGKVVLPANAPAIPILDQSVNATPTLSVDPLGDVTFTARADDRVARTLLVVPSAPLPLGNGTLNFTVACTPASSGPAVPGVVQLVVTDAAPLPTSIGTLEQGKDLVLTLAPELTPFLQVTAISIHVADQPAQTLLAGAYGTVTRDTSKISVVYAADSTVLAASDTLNVSRGLVYEGNSGICVSRSGLVEMPITISAHVAGAASDPPSLRGTVSVDCDLANKLNEEAQRGGGGGGESGNGATTTSAGCSAAPKPIGETGLGFLATAFALAALVRRRIAARTNHET